jgi:hypothetical protein
MTNEEARNRFIGGWQLVSCINHHPDGSEDHPIGPDPLGQIMYSLDGHMTAQLIRTTPSEAAPLDLPYVQIMPDYAGYFGPLMRRGVSSPITSPARRAPA